MASIPHLSTAGDCCAAGFRSDLRRSWVNLDTFGRGDAAIHVRYASNSDQDSKSQRNVAMCQEESNCTAAMWRGVTAKTPNRGPLGSSAPDRSSETILRNAQTAAPAFRRRDQRSPGGLQRTPSIPLTFDPSYGLCAPALIPISDPDGKIFFPNTMTYSNVDIIEICLS
jgi:hypothetical protein